MLNHAAVIIAEDETYIAMALQWAVEDAGGTVIGPAATVGDTLALLDDNFVEAAILDVNLADGDITPVVERLIAIGAQIIFQTGTGLPPELAARFPGLNVQMKPYNPERLVEQLGEMLRVKQTHAALIR
ncbi:MAG: response regulator [Novosphingobium sp.]